MFGFFPSCLLFKRSTKAQVSSYYIPADPPIPWNRVLRHRQPELLGGVINKIDAIIKALSCFLLPWYLLSCLAYC